MCKIIRQTTEFLGFKPGFWFGFGSILNIYGLSNQIKPKIRNFEDDYKSLQKDFEMIYYDFNSVFKQVMNDLDKSNHLKKN